MVICLERGADLHTAQLMPLPLTVSCSEWQWHLLGHIQVCTSLPRMPFLPPNQQRQSTEGHDTRVTNISNSFTYKMAAKTS